MTALIRKILAAAAACTAALSVQAVQFDLVGEDLGLVVHAVAVPGEPHNLFTVTLDGLVNHVQPGGESRPVLELGSVVTAREGEQGLFSLALHPDYLRDPRAFVVYTARDSGSLELAEYSFDRPAEGGRVLMSIPMPEPYHHGGMAGFGPDGYLYVSVGNGVAALESLTREPYVSQDPATLYGKLLRIDVDNREPYGIPQDNPYLLEPGARPEVWATGFRNPWKFTWSPDGDMLVADVGQDLVEEISLVTRGGNYGWPLREGPVCFRLGLEAPVLSPDCSSPALTDPVIHYFHDEAGGRSVTGGEFLESGEYVFADFVSGRVWLAEPGTWQFRVLDDAPKTVWSGFVRTGDGRVYGHDITGRLYRLTASTGSP